MKTIHKNYSIAILISAILISYAAHARISVGLVNLIIEMQFIHILSCIVITSILFNSTYTKRLHRVIFDRENARGTHLLRSYIMNHFNLAVFCIAMAVILSVSAKVDTSVVFTTGIIQLDRVFTSILIGAATLNIFYMALLTRTIVDGMVDSAAQE